MKNIYKYLMLPIISFMIICSLYFAPKSVVAYNTKNLKPASQVVYQNKIPYN